MEGGRRLSVGGGMTAGGNYNSFDRRILNGFNFTLYLLENQYCVCNNVSILLEPFI